jgi:translation initiation factor 1
VDYKFQIYTQFNALYLFESKYVKINEYRFIMDRKKSGGIVYSTNPDFKFGEEAGAEATLPANQQMLYIWLDSKARKGKTVTLIRGFKGSEPDLENLARQIKSLCGTGGSVKNGEIIIQGDFREKIIAFLNREGFKTKKAGG